MNKKQELLTPKEAASLLHISTTSLQNWANLGKIKAVRTLGNHRRYLRTEIEKILNKKN